MGGRAPEAKDLLDVYLEAEVAEGGAKLSSEQLLKNMFDVFLGGSDTTASTICAAMFEVRRETGSEVASNKTRRSINNSPSDLPYAHYDHHHHHHHHDQNRSSPTPASTPACCRSSRAST